MPNEIIWELISQFYPNLTTYEVNINGKNQTDPECLLVSPILKFK